MIGLFTLDVLNTAVVTGTAVYIYSAYLKVAVFPRLGQLVDESQLVSGFQQLVLAVLGGRVVDLILHCAFHSALGQLGFSCFAERDCQNGLANFNGGSFLLTEIGRASCRERV